MRPVNFARVRPAVAALALAALGQACAHNEGYVVFVHGSADSAATAALETQLDDARAAVERAGGRIVVGGVEVERQLPNPAAEQLVPMPLGHMAVAEFDSRRAARRFSRGPEARALQQRGQGLGVVTVARFSAKPFRPLPTMPDAPALCERPPAAPPAFILLDGITMKKGPAAPFRVMRYMKRNLPRLEDAEVDLLATLAVEHVDAGAFDFDMLFLSQWPSVETFDDFHAESDFIDDARRLRNRAFRRFGEAKGNVRACAVEVAPE